MTQSQVTFSKCAFPALTAWMLIAIEKLSMAHCKVENCIKGTFLWNVVFNVLITFLMLRMVVYSLVFLHVQMRRNWKRI